MSFAALENLLSVLESGNLEEKHVALSHLLNAARNGTVFDVDRLVICLINADHFETVQKIFVLLSYLAIQDESCKRKLCKISAIFHLVSKILASGSVKKIIGVFHFLLAVLHLDESVELSESMEETKIEIFEAKDKVRGMGILNQMCMLFLQSNSDSAVWQSLCQCLAECCTGTLNNQNESSHILPKCLKQLEGSFKLDLVNLVIALTYNNHKNQERFVLLGGIQCIARNFLYTHKGIELLCVSMTNYPPAVQEAKMCNLIPQIEAIYKKSDVTDPSINQVMLSKWCSLALWILKNSVLENANDFNKLTKNPSNLPKNNKKTPEKSGKHLFETLNSKISNMENSTKTTLGSLISKFDAINSLPSSPANKIRPSIYNFNAVHPYLSKTSQDAKETREKCLSNRWNISLHRHNDKENVYFNPQFNTENNCMELSNNNIKSFLFTNENNKENSLMLRSALESVDETFQDFKPTFTSSPLQLNENNLSKSDQRNESIFKIPAYPKRFEDEFLGLLSKSNNKEPKAYQNKSQSESDETIKSITASSKVRQLVKQVIDTHNELGSINGNNNENILFYLKPEGWKRVSNKSQIENEDKTENGYDDGGKSNNIIGFNISVKHNNNTAIREKEPPLPTTIPDSNKLDSSISSCVSVGSHAGFEKPSFSENDNVSITSNKSNFMNPDSKNVIKRLKIGVSLYGCDFQKISNVLWSKKEHVSAKFLYAVYRKHIVRK